MENEEVRYIINNFPSEPNDAFPTEALQQQVAEIFKKDLMLFLTKIKPDETKAICSVSSKSYPDSSIFDGAGSYLTAYVYLLQFLSNLELQNDTEKEAIKGLLKAESTTGSELNFDDLAKRASTSFESLTKLQKQIEKSSKKTQISYYFGGPGLFLNGCLLAYYLNDKQLFSNNLVQLLSYQKLIEKDQENYYKEILYGISGYLYCLLELQERFENIENKDFQVSLGSSVRDLLEILLEDGLSNWGKNLNLQKPPKDFRLYYTFHKKEYFGAAHGLFGVLYLLMKAYILNKDLLEKETEKFAEALKISIKHSINYILDFQTASGGFPSSEKRRGDDSLVQFCHGSPGSIPCLLIAAKFFNGEPLGEKCLKSALLAGENVWKYGILKKGFGLCHGISGNGYSLLSIYRETNDPVWLYRAYCFLSVKTDKNYTTIIDNFEFHDRDVIGKSDNPYSVMLGLSGDLCYETGLLLPNYARFPGFEV